MNCHKIPLLPGARFFSTVGLLFLAALATAQTPPITVGGQSSCDFSDLQSAIEFVASEHPDELVQIRVNRDVEIASPPLSVRGARIAMQGGYFDCDSDTRAGMTNLSARGENRVFVVAEALTEPDRSSQLILRDIQVLGGRAFNGAGIQISGGSEVVLEDSTVLDSVATLRGGGIEVLKKSKLTISGNSRVSANQAGRLGRSGLGAGIYCQGDANARGRVNLSGEVEIFGNHAIRDGDELARGGGFYLARCDLEMGGNVKVLSNRATEGGGGYLDDESRASLLLDADEDTAPRFESNQVTKQGGGLKISRSSSITMDRVSFIDNFATNSSGTASGGALALQLDSTSVLGGTGCLEGSRCPVFTGNRADSGALAYIGSGSSLLLAATLIADNVATESSLVLMTGFNPEVSLVTSFIAHNSVAQIVSNTFPKSPTSSGQADISIYQNTIADNPGLNSVVHMDNRTGTERLMDFSNNLVMEANVPVLTGSSQFDLENWSCHVGSSRQLLPFDRQIIIDSPDFVDPASLDYHLGHNSEAIDVCNKGLRFLGVDIDGEPRPVDHPSRPGDFHNDAGADEVQVVRDRIFNDGFEQQDL